MSTVIRRRRTSRLEIGPYKRHELLTGEVRYPALDYSGYGNGIDTDLSKFISDEMRNDWRNNREELIEFWQSGEYTTPDVFPDSLPWLFVRGGAGTLPWAARHLKVGWANST
jgi:hypothetical protein